MTLQKKELPTVGDGLPREWFIFDGYNNGCGMDQFSDTFKAKFGSELAQLIRSVRRFIINHSLEEKGDDFVCVPYDVIVERNPGLQVHFDKILRVTGHTFKEFSDSLNESIINPGDPRLKQSDLS